MHGMRKTTRKQGKTQKNPVPQWKSKQLLVERKLGRLRARVRKMCYMKGMPPMAFLQERAEGSLLIVGIESMVEKLKNCEDLQEAFKGATEAASDTEATVDCRGVSLQYDPYSCDIDDVRACVSQIVAPVGKAARSFWRSESCKPSWWPNDCPFRSPDEVYQGDDGRQHRYLQAHNLREIVSKFLIHIKKNIADGIQPIHQCDEDKSSKKRKRGKKLKTRKLPTALQKVDKVETAEKKHEDQEEPMVKKQKIEKKEMRTGMDKELPKKKDLKDQEEKKNLIKEDKENEKPAKAEKEHLKDEEKKKTNEELEDNKKTGRRHQEMDGDEKFEEGLKSKDPAMCLQGIIEGAKPGFDIALQLQEDDVVFKFRVEVDIKPNYSKTKFIRKQLPNYVLCGEGVPFWELLYKLPAVVQLKVLAFGLVHLNHYASQYFKLTSSIHEIRDCLKVTKSSTKEEHTYENINRLLYKELWKVAEEDVPSPMAIMLLAGLVERDIVFHSAKDQISSRPCPCTTTCGDQPLHIYMDRTWQAFVAVPRHLFSGTRHIRSEPEMVASTNLPGLEINKRLFTYKGLEVYSEDRTRVERGEWLDDNVVNFLIRYFIDEEGIGDKVVSLDSQFPLALMQENSRGRGRLTLSGYNFTRARRWLTRSGVLTRQLVLIPYCNNTHWVLFAFEVEKQTLLTLCSIQGRYKKEVESISRCLTEFWEQNGKNITVTKKDLNVPIQKNGNDCGVHVAYMAKSLIESSDLSATDLQTMVSRGWIEEQGRDAIVSIIDRLSS